MDYVLSTTLWLPAAGALLIALVPSRFETEIKICGLLVALGTFVVSLCVYDCIDPSSGAFQLVEKQPWIPFWGISYSLGVDGISLWLILLTTFLTPLVILSSWNSIKKHGKGWIISMLLLEFGMLGAFVATDLVLFYIFFELMLVPMYLIIGVWGGANRIYAAIKFFLFTVFGSLLMLLAIIYLGFLQSHPGGTPSFALEDLAGLALPLHIQVPLFLAFTLAFAIKVPLFPFHTWLPDAHVEAPTGGSIILAGVLLKLGTYGFLRFVLPLFPDATVQFAPALATLAVIGIIYGALVAWVQPDLKKLVAYSSVSHLGFCVLGIFALNQTAIEGSILQMINHGLSTGALFLLVGVIYDRRHTRELAKLGGLAASMPRFAVVFVIATLSSVGLPGLNGFVGEFLILSGSFRWNTTFGTLAALGVILAALYLLLMVQKVLFGPITHEENRNLPDIAWNEIAAVVPLVILMVWIGVRPMTFLGPMKASVERVIEQVANRPAPPGMLMTSGSSSGPATEGGVR